MKPFFFRMILPLLFAGALWPAPASSFDLLRIGLGGEGSALGSAGAARTGTLEGAFGNPATLATVPQDIMILGSVNPYLDMLLFNAAASFKVGNILTLAVSGRGLLYGGIAGDQTSPSDIGRPISTGDAVLALSLALPLGYLFHGPFELNLGAQLKYLSQRLDDASLTGWVVDGGIQGAWKTGPFQVGVGAHVQNLGRIDDGINPWAPPSVGVAGASLRFSPSPTLSLLALSDAELDLESGLVRGRLGIEGGLFQKFFLRAGYLLGDDFSGNRGLSLGIGLRFALGTGQWGLDYSMVPLPAWGGTQHQIQLCVGWNRARQP